MGLWVWGLGFRAYSSVWVSRLGLRVPKAILSRLKHHIAQYIKPMAWVVGLSKPQTQEPCTYPWATEHLGGCEIKDTWNSSDYHVKAIWGFPKIRGTILGVPIIKSIVFGGLYWGPLILGNYHMLRTGVLS